MEQPSYITIKPKSDRKEFFNIYLYNDINNDIINHSLITQSINYKLDDNNWKTFTIPYNNYMTRFVLYGYQVTLGDYQEKIDSNNFAYTLSNNNFGRYAYSCSYDYEIIDFNPSGSNEPDIPDTPSEPDIPDTPVQDEYDYEYYKNQPLTFEILEDGKIWLDISGSSPYYKFYYSYDKLTWDKFLYFNEDGGLVVHKNDKIYFGAYTNVFTNEFSNYDDFDNTFYNSTLAHIDLQMQYCHFSTTCKFNISGNVLSLMNKSDFIHWPGLNVNLYALFLNCDKLISAKNLILSSDSIGGTNGTEYVYTFMFEGCTSLIEAPIIYKYVNSTGFDYSTEHCYGLKGMFLNCESLNSLIFLHNIINDDLETYKNWLSGTSSNGILYKDPSVDASLFRDIIPEGWTIEDYIEE